jgi:hypothetical protein
MIPNRIVKRIQTKPQPISLDDEVILITKSRSGFPKYLNIGDIGVAKRFEVYHVYVDFTKTYPSGFTERGIRVNHLKVPKKLLANKNIIRDIKISDILS